MRQVQNFIREQKMIMPGDFVIAGVSGGADSVCLFFELLAYQKEIPFSMEVVHIEHGIRGQDSLADANYVENLCKEYGVPFHLVSCDIKKMAQETSLTVEEAGRKARYQAFEQAAKKSGRSNCKIAVAHNLDDQAETILMNLARGSGLRGLGGIRPVRENIIRPLLNTRRSEIEAALRGRQITWRTDETNHQTEYTRNRIRLEILPLLAQGVNGQAASHIAQASSKPKYSNVKSIEQYLECGLEEIELKRCLQRTKNLISDIERVLSQLDDEEQEILRLWYVDKKPKEQILAAMHIESLSTLYSLRNKAVANFALRYYGAPTLMSI